jgi:hypothetical protein
MVQSGDIDSLYLVGCQALQLTHAQEHRPVLTLIFEGSFDVCGHRAKCILSQSFHLPVEMRRRKNHRHAFMKRCHHVVRFSRDDRTRINPSEAEGYPRCKTRTKTSLLFIRHRVEQLVIYPPGSVAMRALKYMIRAEVYMSKQPNNSRRRGLERSNTTWWYSLTLWQRA